MWLLHQINVSNLARRTCCLKASLVEVSIVDVCCHGHGEAHSLSVSTSLSFFPRECAEAFKELCNTRNKGTEEPCNARSNKSRRGVQVVKEYLYSQCQDGFDLSNIPDHLMNITSQNAWGSQRVCGVHRGSVGFTEGPWVSRRACGVHRVRGVHGGSVVFTEGM